MNLESLGNPTNRPSQREQAEKIRVRLRRKTRKPREVANAECCNGACEVSWKPYSLEQSAEPRPS